MRQKDQRPEKRQRKVRSSKNASAHKLMNTKMSVVAVSVALSLGVAYPAFSASQPTSDSPFSASNLGSTATVASGSTSTTASGSTATTSVSATGSTSPGGVTNMTGTGNAKLPQSGVANEPGAMPYDPSETVISNAQSCAERTTEIVKETTEAAIETAGTNFNVDDYWQKVRSGGCLVSVQDSISLANQITALSGGSISSVIMSQVKSKLADAGNKMLQNVFDKGCEVMLEASQNVYGPIGELVNKYGIYSDPNYVGDQLEGMVDTGINNAIFDFDAKLSKIQQDILERDKGKPSSGGSTGGGSGGLLPDASGGMGSSSGNTNIDDAQKAAADQSAKDLANSRNSLAFPYYQKERFEYATRPDGDRYKSKRFSDLFINTLVTGGGQGAQIGTTQVALNANSSLKTVKNSLDACTYVAQISSINNEIKALAAKYGIPDASQNQIQPLNLSPAYWAAADRYAKTNNNECKAEATAQTMAVQQYAEQSTQSSDTIDYGSVSTGQSLPASSARTVTTAPSTSGSVSTAPSTNAETQYMQQLQQNNSTTDAAPTTSTDTSSSNNPFSRMKDFFN